MKVQAIKTVTQPIRPISKVKKDEQTPEKPVRTEITENLGKRPPLYWLV